MPNIQILIVPPDASQYPRELLHILTNMKHIVGGNIEALVPFDELLAKYTAMFSYPQIFIN